MFKTKSVRKSLSSSASLLGIAAGAFGWSGLAKAESEDSQAQTLLLPEHYHQSNDGLVTFKLQTGEQLSLNPDQYVILQDGLLLVTDELAQASIQSLPVMGSIRAQLTSELQPVRSPDGSVVLASDTSPLWSGDGPAPRLFEEVDIQRYELAQNNSETQTQSEANLGQAAGAAAGGLSLVGLSLASGVFGTRSEQATKEEESSAPAPPPETEFLSNAMFQALTPASARVFTGSAGDSFIGYTAADSTAQDALIDAGKGAGNSATFDMSAGGNNTLVADDDAASDSGSIDYTGGSGDDSLTFSDDLAYDGGTATFDMSLGGNNTFVAGSSAASSGSLSYTGGSGDDSLTFGPNLVLDGGTGTFDMSLGGNNTFVVGDRAASSSGSIAYTGGSGDDSLTFGSDLASSGTATFDMSLGGNNTFVAGINAASSSGSIVYTGGSGDDSLMFGGDLAYGGTVTLDLGDDTAAETVTFQGTIGDNGGSVTIKNYNYNHDKIDVPTGVTADLSELSGFLSNITWTDSSGDYTIIFEGTRTGSAEDPINFARLIDDII